MRTVELSDIFACPRCGGEISFSNRVWHCLNCKRNWDVDEYGVVHFIDHNIFFGADQNGMNELLKEMRSMSVDELFNNTGRLEKTYRDFEYAYCLDPSRADWTVLGDFQDKVVADLGCGYGTVSIPLASRAKSIISVDACQERLRFLSMVARFRGIRNICPIHGDVLDLPLKGSKVDAIILFGLLEYVATWGNNQECPETLQTRFLSQLRDYLSVGGELWIGIENRLNPLYFTGRTHHGDVAFTPLMPRKIADILTYALKRTTYRTYTYSKQGYRRILERAGYSDINFYYPFPDYKSPKFILASDRGRLFSRYVAQTGVAAETRRLIYKAGFKGFRLVDWFRLYGVFSPSYIIEAKR